MTEPEVPSPAPGRLGTFARRHPGLVVTFAYLAATGVGMLSSSTFYGLFGVNIFDFAQISDFVLVPIRNPLATVAIAAAGPALWVIMKSDDWLDRRFAWWRYLYGSAKVRAWSRAPGAWVLYLLLYAHAFSLIHSRWSASKIRGGERPAVEVQLQAGTYDGRDATRPFRATLLGTTSTHVLLYDDESEVVTVIPFENVALLTIE